METITDTIIIGGGVIGVAIAAELIDRDCMVVDAGPPRAGSSDSNAGHVVVSHATPFAAPGMVGMGVRSLLARDGAFALSRVRTASETARTVAWMTRFAANCTRSNAQRFTPAMLKLLRASAARIDAIGIATTPRGMWEVFTSQNAEASAIAAVQHMHSLGIGAHVLTGSEARSADPILTSAVGAIAVLEEDFGLDPHVLWRTLRQSNPRAQFMEDTTVTKIERRDGGGFNLVTNSGVLHARNVVVAAGAWSPSLLDPLGVRLPIQSAKGYSITVRDPDPQALHPMILSDQKTAVDPMDAGDVVAGESVEGGSGKRLRISARFELTTPSDRSIDSRRITQMYERAAFTLKLPPIPANLSDLDPWTGLRPASADGAPFIGPVAHTPGLFVATGHGMIGTSMAMGTAELMGRYLRHESIDPQELALLPTRKG